MRKPLLLLIAFIIGSIYLVLGILDLKYYGPNWDEPVHFIRGYAILHYFLTGEKNYPDSPGARRSHYQLNYYNYTYFEDQMSNAVNKRHVGFAGGGHPPLSDVLAAASNRILYSRLGIIGDIESFHFYSVILSSLLAVALFYFVARYYSVFSGLITALSFALYPFFLGESRFNIKDIPEAVFYAFTILFFYKGVVVNKGRWIFVSSIFFSLALGTKLNIVFVPLILIPWFAIFSIQAIHKEKLAPFFKKRKLLLLSLLWYPLLSIGLFVASWPLLWPDLWNRLLTIFYYYKEIGLTLPNDPRFLTPFGFSSYAVVWILYTTPLITLLLFGIGVFYSFTKGLKEKHKTSLLILFWFIIPVLRVTIPNTSIYGGVRQIMEYIPAMAILSGIGAAYIVKLLNGYIAILIKTIWKKQFNNIAIEQWSNRIRVTLQLIVIISFIPITLKIISLHPNESIYFNPIIGGLKGASVQNIPGWGNSLGSTYRQGVNWLNIHAEENAKLATIYELRSNISAEIILRKDIQLVNSFRSTTRREREYIIGVTHHGTYEDQYHRQYLERYLNPVYELTVDGVAVLKIWKNDFVHTKEAYKKEEKEIKNFTLQKGENTLQIKLPRRVEITKIIIHYDPQNCTLPSNGYFEHSIFGRKWQKSGGDFLAIPFSTWFKTQPEKGVLQFIFAAEQVRFVQMVINDENSCLLIHPVTVELFHI